MYEIGNSEARPRKRCPVATIAAGLLGAAVLCQPDSAGAMPPLPGGGLPSLPGGGGRGGGVNAGEAGGVRAGEANGGYARGGYGGYGNRGYGCGNGGYGCRGWGFVGSFPAGGSYSDSQTSASQVWYYCSAPAGYYPYVTQCGTAWQTVPASGAMSQGGSVVVGGGWAGGRAGGFQGGGAGGLRAGGFHGP
jgi:hypothetical protein